MIVDFYLTDDQKPGIIILPENDLERFSLIKWSEGYDKEPKESFLVISDLIAKKEDNE